MGQSANASASLPEVHIDDRQARLDAAIALFRSEASASGYVVEEVRLRLPVPDVNITPRVIITKQSSSVATPPAFLKAKQPHPLPSYLPTTLPDHPAPSRRECEQSYSKSTNSNVFGRHVKPISTLDTYSGNTLSTSSGGLKRTVSGSVIFHPVSGKAKSTKQEFIHSDIQPSQTPLEVIPLSLITHVSKNDSSSVPGKVSHKKPKSGAFWKTVIGGERGRAILGAAESRHVVQHAVDGPKLGPSTIEEQDTAKLEVQSSIKLEMQDSKVGEEDVCELTEEQRRAKEKRAKNMLHVSDHNIPESHVQLLLSSAADISAREQASVPKKDTESPVKKVSKTVGKEVLASPQEPYNRRPSGPKSIPSSHGQQSSSRGRTGSSDRHQSRFSCARPFRCHKCPSSFDRDGHLRVHILAVHEKKRPFVCQTCDSSFGHSSSLLRHVRTIHQASPAVGSVRRNLPLRSCQNSDDSGKTKSDDMCEAEEDDSEKHFRCSACGQAFHRVALLNRHVANRHPLQSSSLEKSDDRQTSP